MGGIASGSAGDGAPLRPPTLWRNPDFLKLWSAQAVSSLGSRITREGLPFAAVVSLGASPAQIGILAALSRAPAILIGLTAGGAIDRNRRRPVLIAADVGRAAILITVPLAAWSHALTIGQLYAVAALVGALSVVFDIADHAYLRTLIPREQLVDGNSRLAVTESIAEIGGPALYGALFQILTAPIAIAVNAATYLFSAASLATIRAPEPPGATATGAKDNLFGDLVVAARETSRNPPVLALLGIGTGAALFGAFFSALYIVYAVRTLGLSAAMLGATVAVGGVAALAGAALTGRIVRRIGIGPAFVVTGLIAGAGSLFIPAAHGTPVLGMAMLMVAQLIGDSLGTVTEICGRSLRQSLVKPDMMGRVGGLFAISSGVTGIGGALLGGYLGGVIGMRPTLLIAALGVTISAAVGLVSPLMRARSIDPPLEDDQGASA